MFKRLFSICAISALTGCATGPQQPPEAPISVQLAGSAVEVQDFIQHRSMTRGSSALQVETANDRTLIMKGLCTALPDMTPFKCSMIMMAVGNSQWDGPYAVMTFGLMKFEETLTLRFKLNGAQLTHLEKPTV